MSTDLKKRLLRLLKEDEELRYAVAGLVGLEDIKKGQWELRAASEAIASAQARTEQGIASLEDAIARLAEAQARTEERVASLEETMARLAEAQARTERRVTSLEDAVIKLAEAQARTELAVQELSRQVGRLSDTLGFGLEDVARVVLPGWLYRHEGIVIEDLPRRFFSVDGEVVEVNLYGEGVRDGERVVIVGESRSRIFGRDVEEFDAVAERVSRLTTHRVYKLMFGYWVHPSAEEEGRRRGVRLVASYMR